MAGSIETVKKRVENQLRDLLETTAGELTEADLNRSHSDVADNLWDMYIEGGVPAKQQAAVRKFFLARFDAIAPEVIRGNSKKAKAAPSNADKLADDLEGAVANQEWAKAKKLVEKGADAGRPNHAHNETALYTTLRYASFQAMLGNLTKGERGKVIALATLMLERGADPNVERMGKSGNALEEAISLGDVGLVKLLVAKGAKVTKKHREGVEDPKILAILKKK
jgi:ankyrin repeat protein